MALSAKQEGLSFGTHRIKNAKGSADGVWVIDARMGFDVTETQFVAHGYAPLIETLPWAGRDRGLQAKVDPAGLNCFGAAFKGALRAAP